MKTLNKSTKARFSLPENVTYKLTDKDGNVKSMFVENKFGTAVLKFARKHLSTNPIDSATGKVKAGWKNYLAAYGLRVAGLTGNYASERVISNLITNAGFAGVASRINGSGGEAAFTYIALGTGATAANVADTTLGTELATAGLSRANATASRITTDVTNDSARLTYTFTVTGTAAVTESGVLNAASAGTLLARQVFSAVNVVNGDSLTITWTFDID